MTEETKPVRNARPVGRRTKDSYQNVGASLGWDTKNLSSFSTYGFHPITRFRQELEWLYRGQWLVRQAVDAPASDMTRAGIAIHSALEPDQEQALQGALRKWEIWTKLRHTAQWARLYGGALAIHLIDGQDLSTPLRPETVGPGQYRGLYVMDRWMISPVNEYVTEMGPDLGKPKFYQNTVNSTGLGPAKIHYSRVIRMDGCDLPYLQSQSENTWGLSIIEPMWDRITAFDSTTQGAIQLVYRAYLRTMKVKDLRQIVAAGEKSPQMAGLVKTLEFVRLMQSNEGMTVIDADDTFETHTYTFAGLSDVLMQVSQQLSGATQIPLVRLFGQSPAGLNSTGESDLALYEASIHAQQEGRLRMPLQQILEMLCRSELGIEPPKGTTFGFEPIFSMSNEERSDYALKTTQAIVAAEQAGIIDRPAALRELKETNHIGGLWSNITDEMIEEVEALPPAPGEIDPETGQMVPLPGEELPGAKENGEPDSDKGAPGDN